MPVNPALSVLLPVYNAQAYLAEALDSLLNQDMPDFELLIIDDGSTDSSKRIIEAYCRKDNRIRFQSRPNEGLVRTLNELAGMATSQLLVRMDADDICKPSRFAAQLAFMNSHPEVVACGTRARLVDPDGDPVSDDFFHCTEHAEIDSSNLAMKAMICHPTAVIRASAFGEVGGYREAYKHAEDLDIFLRLAEVGKLANLASIELDYRLHPQSIGHAKQYEQMLSARAAVEAAKVRRNIQSMVQAPIEIAGRPVNVMERDHTRKWAWWALRAGYGTTARKHAWKLLRDEPMSLENYRLIFCALRGY